jgi:hypothetical protein
LLNTHRSEHGIGSRGGIFSGSRVRADWGNEPLENSRSILPVSILSVLRRYRHKLRNLEESGEHFTRLVRADEPGRRGKGKLHVR